MLRQLPLVLAGLFTLYLVVPGADVVAERLQMPWPVPVLLACLQAASVPLSLSRPVAAWWLSLVAMVPFPLLLAALGAPPARDTPWPWTEPGFLAHLVVTLIVAWRVSARLFVTQWLLTLLVGGVLAVVLRPEGAGQGLYAFGILSGVGLLLLAAVRGRREAQRQLRRQENSPRSNGSAGRCWRNGPASHGSCTMSWRTTCPSSRYRRKPRRTSSPIRRR